MMCRLALVFLVLPPVLASTADPANPPQQAELDAAASDPPAAYCGIYSLYYAARALGRDLEFHDLLRPEYVSSRQGSSLEDLIRAATEQELHTESVGRMTCAMLRYVHCPVILHVKKDLVTAKDYNHWILFTGTEEGKACIYDGTRPVELVDFADLSARWDGVGLLIADAPISTKLLGLVFAAQFVCVVGAVAAMIALLVWVQRRWVGKQSAICWAIGWRGFFRETAMLAVLALLLGAGFRWINAGGFLSHSPAVAAIQDKHLAGFLPKVKVEDLPRLLPATDVTVVDARLPTDFESGHLDGAKNIPPDSSSEQCRKLLEGVPASNRILIYCQSNGCPYSETVARKLLRLGYSQILYFRDGWIAWEQYQQYAGF